MAGLFGQLFEIKIDQQNVKDLVKKAQPDAKGAEEIDTDKLLKSKKVSLMEKLSVIKAHVYKVLGKQKANTVVLDSRQALHDYITGAIEYGAVAVDTETNNSLDPVTCRLMGLCLYYPGSKQAYIPVNHINLETAERLPNQVTEEEIREELQRLKDVQTFIVMHNGKFDYEVLKATCGIELPPDWDTMTAARLLDENELAGLKMQYITKIDPSQAKYDIEALFENIQYAIVDPHVFALYAATDSMMTFKLYEYQKPMFELPENERVYWVFKNIEMPIVVVTAEMELRGVSIDTKFGKSLKLKYKQLLDDLDAEISEVLNSYEDRVSAWKLDPLGGGSRMHVYMPKKSKKSRAELEATYTYLEPDEIEIKDKDGNIVKKKNPHAGKYYKLGKCGADMLSNPINLASPAQLAILFYDILGAPVVSKKSPRGTGEDELTAILEKRPELKLCELILKRRGIVKLITTYIDVIPALVKHWPDGRIRFHLNALGTDTGRYSSGGKLKFFENDQPVVVSGINIQNIPLTFRVGA